MSIDLEEKIEEAIRKAFRDEEKAKAAMETLKKRESKVKEVERRLSDLRSACRGLKGLEDELNVDLRDVKKGIVEEVEDCLK